MILSYLKKKLIPETDDVRQLKAAYKEVMRSAAGKIVLKHIIEISHLYESVDASDAMRISYYNGRKDMALVILKNINETPEETERLINHLNQPNIHTEL